MIPAITAHAMIKGITISIGISSPSYDFNKYVEKRRNPTIKKKQKILLYHNRQYFYLARLSRDGSSHEQDLIR